LAETQLARHPQAPAYWARWARSARVLTSAFPFCSLIGLEAQTVNLVDANADVNRLRTAGNTIGHQDVDWNRDEQRSDGKARHRTHISTPAPSAYGLPFVVEIKS